MGLLIFDEPKRPEMEAAGEVVAWLVSVQPKNEGVRIKDEQRDKPVDLKLRTKHFALRIIRLYTEGEYSF